MSTDGAARAARVLSERLSARPRIAVVLGSGLGGLAERLDSPEPVPLSDLPGLPEPGVQGHGGRFVAGRLSGTEVLLQVGRYHAYEGHPLETVVAPVRIMAAFGIEVLILTNAVGAIDPRIDPGDIVLLDDQLCLSFRSPLAGPVAPGEARFPDMSAPFDPRLQRLAGEVARTQRIPLHHGTYAWVLGPAYETAAEVRMLARAGADVVGMSTVPESIAASAAGLRCLGLSLVTNRATGLSASALSHDDVLAVGRRAGERLGTLVTGVIGTLNTDGAVNSRTQAGDGQKANGSGQAK